MEFFKRVWHKIKMLPLRPVIFLTPLELQGHTVPHLKGLMCGKMEARKLRCGSIFILCHALLKNAILLHIEATVQIFIGPSVQVSIKKEI